MKPIKPVGILFIMTAGLLALLLPLWQTAAQTTTWTVSGTVIYYGNAAAPPTVEVGVQLELGAPPVDTVDTAVPVGTFTFTGAPDGGAAYIYALLDMNNSGGPPDAGDLLAYYDGNHDGEPDLVITNSDVSGLEIAVGNLVYVDAAAAGTGDGSSWANAYTDLQSALAAATTDTEVWIVGGTYLPTSGSDRSQTFQLNSGVEMYGGFAGNETFRHNRDWRQMPTILSGDIGVAGVATDNSYHVVTGNGTDATAVLDGVIITGGYANSSGNDDKGGGLHIAGGSPTVMNVAIIDNYASNHGGGMVVQSVGSTPLLVNCLFSGNSTNFNGAIASLDNASPTLIHVTVVGNSGGNGGGIVNLEGGQATVANSIIWGNSGGQIGLQSGASIAVTYSLVQGGYTGTGNLDATPIFVDADGADNTAGTLDDDLRLQMTSPGVDAGNNTAVPADITDLDGDGSVSEAIPLDQAGGPRFTDVPFTADSGSGTAPLVDMGAFEVPLTAGNLLVNQAGGTDQAGCGQGSAVPCASIAYIVANVASSGDTVLIGPGTYTETVTMTPGVNLVGQFGAAATVLDGEASRPLLVADGTGFTEPVLVAGVTVQHGYTAVTGGGIQIVNGARMTISETQIISNSAGNNDGGISVRDGGAALTLVDSVVAENTQSGLWLSNGTATVSNTLFRDNSGNSWGGGIGAEMGGALTVTDSTFSGNSAPYGGGIMNSAVALTVTNSTFTGNSASGQGGGVHIRDGAVFTISGNTFSDNQSAHGGGLLVADSAVSRIARVAATSGIINDNFFTDNSASGVGGGAVAVENVPVLEISDNTIQGGSSGMDIANSGGTVENNVVAVTASAAAVTLRNGSIATLRHNTLVGSGSGSGIVVSDNAAPLIANNIVSGYAIGIQGSGTVTPTLSHNLLWQTTTGYSGIAAGSSDLARNPDFVNAAAGDYHLGACSYAVETGDAANSASTDFDGDARPFAGFGTTAVTDIGADERMTVSASPPWAGFTVTKNGLTVAMANTSSSATSYAWDFGDGTAVVTTTNPSHTYASPGVYTVSLTAQNESGCVDVAQATVTVDIFYIYLPMVVRP